MKRILGQKNANIIDETRRYVTATGVWGVISFPFGVWGLAANGFLFFFGIMKRILGQKNANIIIGDSWLDEPGPKFWR